MLALHNDLENIPSTFILWRDYRAEVYNLFGTRVWFHGRGGWEDAQWQLKIGFVVQWESNPATDLTIGGAQRGNASDGEWL